MTDQIITSFRITGEANPRSVRWRVRWKKDHQALWWTVNEYFNQRFPNSGWSWFTSHDSARPIVQITEQK